MGTPIARSLGETFSVSAFDIDSERASSTPGLRWSATLRALAAALDVLVTVLPGPRELQAAVADAFPHLRPGSLWIEMTSGDREITRELAASAQEHDIDVVSAPAGGTQRPLGVAEGPEARSDAQSGLGTGNDPVCHRSGCSVIPPLQPHQRQPPV